MAAVGDLEVREKRIGRDRGTRVFWMLPWIPSFCPATDIVRRRKYVSVTGCYIHPSFLLNILILRVREKKCLRTIIFIIGSK